MAFAVLAGFILATSSIIVAILSTNIHSYNTDHLIDGFMFENSEAFSGSYFPGDHTFLFKWPIFALLGLFDNSLVAIKVITVIVYCLTVLSIAYIIYRLSNRELLPAAIS